jgi:DNA-binding MltR family transcriptional regulator
MTDFQERIEDLQGLTGKPEELHSLLFDHDDRTTAIMASGLIDDVLALGIMSRFRNTPTDAQISEMFTGYGPLATLSARTSVAYLLGAIGADARHDLQIIRKIRNEFAHVIKPIDFETKPIASRCNSLKLRFKLKPEFEKRIGTGARSQFLHSIMRIFSLTVMHATLETEERKVLKAHKDAIHNAARAAFQQSQKRSSAKRLPSSEK